MPRRIFGFLERFDPKGAYISRWLPDELKSNRPAPVIDYAIERNRSIDEYKNSGVLDERR
ncbi:MAG: hypothetical protein ACKVJE_19045 [Pseudomonadales bacterium]